MAKYFSDEDLILAKPGTDEKIIIRAADLKRAFKALQAIRHPIRQKMMRLMEEKEIISVKEVYKTLNMEQAVASQHLKILRDARIVKTQRQGKHIYYSLNISRLEEIALVLRDVA